MSGKTGNGMDKQCAQLCKRLEESEERFSKMFHASSNMMAITTLKDGRMIDLNDASAGFGGFKREELIGATAAERSLWADPDQRETVVRKLKLEGKVHNWEVDLLSKTGEVRRVLFSADPITVNGEPCILSICVDITARRNAEEALKESKEYLNLIINSIGDPIFVKDREHRFVLVNDALCAFADRRREEMLGESASTQRPRELAASLWKQEEDVFNTGKESLNEDDFTDQRGNVHTIMTRKALLTDKNGNKQIVGVLRDITAYKHLEAQLLQAQKMEAIGVLAGGLAHDFNNILNVINGYSELMLENLPCDNPVREDLNQIKEAGQRAATLTSQLLAFGRKQIMQPEILDLKGIIAQTSSMLRRLIREDIEFKFVAQKDTGLVNADPGQLQQIVMNLAVNARDAMPHGGRLTIETANIDFDEVYVRRHPMAHVGSYVMLAVSDNGIGMDSVTQAHLFEPFFTTKGRGKGTGLGLSTVYGIVKQSNGFIEVYSEPGNGTTFKIYLPRADGRTSELNAERKLQPGFRGCETILLAEDEPALRELASRILRDQGYRVLETANGMEALHLARQHAGKIHLLLTDVVMPGMSGGTLVSQLKAEQQGIKALYISGYTDNTIVHHGMLDSNIAFLQKPFTVDGLARKVWEVLNE